MPNLQESSSKQALEEAETGELRTAVISDVIAEHLRIEGVDTVFGVPGGPIMGMFDALSRSPGMRTVLCKHEQGAVFAAYGHAFITGKLGVAVVTSGPGTTNTLTALACAHQDHIPILVIAGQVGSDGLGRGAAQDSSVFATDVVAMARPVTAASFCASSGKQVLNALPHLLRLAHSRRQPVLLQVPSDVLFETAPGYTPVPALLPAFPNVMARGIPAPDGVAGEALRRVRGGKRIVLLIGAGARHTDSAELVALAEGLDAAVVTSPKGKGTFPENHPLALGVFGFAGTPWAEQAMLSGDIDVLVVLGSALGELASHGWHGALRTPQVIHVDWDAAVPGRSYPAYAVVADIAELVHQWLAELPELPEGGGETLAWVEEVKGECSRNRDFDDARSLAIPLRPGRVFAELQACLPMDATVVCDIGNSMAYAIHGLVLSCGQKFMINLGFACMGHAPAAALGARLAAPDRPVIALIGDAAFAMGGFEVHTAVEYPAPHGSYGGPVFIVFNNGGNGMVGVGVKAQFGGASEIDTGQYRQALNISAIAVGIGAIAVRVSAPGELADKLVEALRPGQRPTVIEVIIAQDAVPPMGARLETLMHFASDGCAKL